MREERTSALEYGVYVLALMLAVFIGWQAYKRWAPSRAARALPEAAQTAVSGGGGQTESAVTMVPAVKLTSVGPRRKKTSAVPPPSR